MSNRQVRDRRFRFGDNWLDFARTLGPDQLTEAERSLRRLLECDSLAGLSFLDIGSGSGLFSLAARKLGARVHSFDFDEDSVFCTTQLRERYFAGDRDWTIEQGSILDDRYVRRLGTFDVVYAWGSCIIPVPCMTRWLLRLAWWDRVVCSDSRSIIAR
jgi:2-polyprenyl-3-methyl-5-hydroxy-6-metoxy-1,4-benzoquinol methylase